MLTSERGQGRQCQIARQENDLERTVLNSIAEYGWHAVNIVEDTMDLHPRIVLAIVSSAALAEDWISLSKTSDSDPTEIFSCDAPMERNRLTEQHWASDAFPLIAGPLWSKSAQRKLDYPTAERQTDPDVGRRSVNHKNAGPYLCVEAPSSLNFYFGCSVDIHQPLPTRQAVSSMSFPRRSDLAASRRCD